MPIGTHGRITTVELTPPGTKRSEQIWEARTRFRDADGASRRVKRTGRSKNAAETNLKGALTERQHNAAVDLTGASRLSEAAARWLDARRADVATGDLGPRSVDEYESVLTLHVLPALGELRLREVTTARCEAWMQALRKHKGPSTCQKARSVLSGILGYAARMGAIIGNPIRDISPVPGGRKRKPRSMTAAERTAWLEWLDTHIAAKPLRDGEPARRAMTWSAERNTSVIADRALGDITRLMLATGVRIGEAMAIGWDEVDLQAGTVAICWHIVRVRGQGLVRLPGAKSDAGDRVLRLPSWCVDMLLRRRIASEGATPVFPDTLGGWRDPNLVMRWMRWSRDEAGFSWVTSHVFRQTVITVLDEAGLSTREVADQAGHSRIGQTQDYMARGIASERAAEVLEDLL